MASCFSLLALDLNFRLEALDLINPVFINQTPDKNLDKLYTDLERQFCNKTCNLFMKVHIKMKEREKLCVC